MSRYAASWSRVRVSFSARKAASDQARPFLTARTASAAVGGWERIGGISECMWTAKWEWLPGSQPLVLTVGVGKGRGGRHAAGRGEDRSNFLKPAGFSSRENIP